jgi:hypothetical protein
LGNYIHEYPEAMKTIAALYVAVDGTYSGLSGVDAWDVNRDARLYGGPHPVVAHPPCQLWTRFAHVNFARWGGEHNRPGNDGGCFAAALASVRKWGGVLEHPAFSDAWKAFMLPRPRFGAWLLSDGLWVCEVWQSAYGHKARKRTWLLYCGHGEPPEPRWDRPESTHQIGFHDQRGTDRNKPTISGKAASATPPVFRDFLLRLARYSCI